MERMQSTWENVVEMDMSESGVRPVTLRELGEMGLDLDAILDMPLGYSQSNGTIALREDLAAIYPGRDARPHRGHQRHLRGELPAGAQRCSATATRSRSKSRTTCSMGRAQEPGREGQPLPAAHRPATGSPTGTSSSARSIRRRGWSTSRIRITRAARCSPKTPCSASWRAAKRSARTCWPTRSTWARRSTASARRSFWGMSDRVIVTSGLSKAYGIPGVRIGWIVGPEGRGRGVLEPARLPHDRAEQDFRRGGARGGAGRESREAVRAHARHPAAEPAGDARMGRQLRRLPDVPRAAGRRAVPDALRFRHAELSSCASASA